MVGQAGRALSAKQLARTVKVDYRLLVASAYSGFVVWHGGLAGSIPLTIATKGHFHADKIGLISTSDTIFSTYNIVIVLAMFVMVPDEKDSVYVDDSKLEETAAADVKDNRPAARLENSRILCLLIGFAGLAYMFDYYVVRNGGLNLNIINFTFLFLAIMGYCLIQLFVTGAIISIGLTYF